MIRTVRRAIKDFLRDRELRSRGIYVANGSYIADGVTIGDYSRINMPSHLGACSIGRFCAIGGRLVVRSTNHRMDLANMQDWAQRNVIGSSVSVAGKAKAAVRIGNAVWIGDSVIILADVSIGDGAIVGAGSVVTKDIPPFSVAVGSPARVIRSRFSPEVVALLTESEWWNWPIEKIRANRWFFEIDLNNENCGEIRQRLADQGLIGVPA